MRITVVMILGSTITFLAACGAGTEPRGEPTVTEVDGVLHVRLPAVEFDAPEWRLREVYATSEGESRLELFRVTGARFVDDGALVLANSGTSELVYLDRAGRLERRFGRAGSGPGEFRGMSTLDVDRSGNLTVYDPRELRLTRLTPAGDVVETTRLSSEDAVVDLLPLSELVDGRILAVFGAVRSFRLSGESRDTVPLVLIDPALIDPAGARWDTLSTWAAREWAYFQFAGGVTRAEVGFGRDLVYSGRSGRVALGSTDSLSVAVFDETGNLAMEITGWGPVGTVDLETADRWRAEFLEQRSQAPPEILRLLEDVPHRDSYPAFEYLLVDAVGRVWIAMYPRPGEDQDWFVVGLDGRVEGRLTLPNGSTLLDATDERVAVLRRNDLDEEYVVVMEIETETQGS